MLLVIFPLRVEEFANRFDYISQYLLLRTLFRLSSLLLLCLALLFLIQESNRDWIGAGLGLLIFLNLLLAHRYLNPSVDRDIYQPNATLGEFERKIASREVPVRIAVLLPRKQELVIYKLTDPVALFKRSMDALVPFWPPYFRLDDVNDVFTFGIGDYYAFKNLLENRDPARRRLALARAGIEYLFFRDSGFIRFGRHFPRAAVFYNAGAMPDREQIFKVWSDPNFPAQLTLLLEGKEAGTGIPRELKPFDPAKIMKYENQKVTIEADAKKRRLALVAQHLLPRLEGGS